MGGAPGDGSGGARRTGGLREIEYFMFALLPCQKKR
jgi:hypothetical protein